MNLFTPGGKVTAATRCDQVTERDFSDTTGRAVGQYDVTENGNVYVSYTQGYKAGGVSLFECTPSFDPETVDAYEVGYKSTFGDGRTHLSAAAFYYDYADFQVKQVVGTNTNTVNAGDAEITGAEIELRTAINDSLTLSGALTLLDTEYQDFVNEDSMKPELGVQQLKGNQLNRAPETSLNVGIAYTTDAPWGGDLTLRLDAAYRSRTYFREFNEKEDSQEAYTVVNLNLSWESADGNWQARLYGKNLTDEGYITNLLGSNTSGGRFGTWGAPRQWGMEVTRNFGG